MRRAVQGLSQRIHCISNITSSYVDSFSNPSSL
jgi:hypothetical protein